MESQTLQRAESVVDTGVLWTIDPIHSTIGFSIKHMLVATAHGRFEGFRGSIRFDGDRPRNVSIEVQIDAASIDTGIKKRDEHLRSADFLDVATYPAITFRGTRIEPVVGRARSGHWRLIGDLTLHGVTHQVELAVEQTGGSNLWDGEAASFAATTTISRKAFGIGFDRPLDAGGLGISDEVSIVIVVRVVARPIEGR